MTGAALGIEQFFHAAAFIPIFLHAAAETFRAADGACRSGKNLYVVGMKFRVHVEADEDGVFVAECPTLPGCISQGDTREAALHNIKDAIAGYLFSLEKHGEAVPLPVNEEVVEVPA